MQKFLALSEEEKDSLTCDEVFAVYLKEVSKKVNENYFRTCVRFILLFRECLNEYGWLKRRDHFQKAEMLDQDEVLKRLQKEEEEGKKEAGEAMEEEEEEIYIPQAEYTAVCNADFAPLICNEFVSEFLYREHGACRLDRADAIDLTRNFCHWIFQKGLTCAKIQLNSLL